MFLANYLGVEIDRGHLSLLYSFIHFFSPPEKSSRCSTQRVFGAELFIVGFRFDDDQFEIKLEGMIGQFIFCIDDFVGDILSVGHFSKRKPL